MPALWKKSYDHHRHHITLLTKVLLVKAIVFPVVMYRCENWTVKKAERRRIDAFELWCWKRLLRVTWTARRSNQSILKETNPECLLEGIMLKQKLQYFGHLMGELIHLKSPWYWERLEAEREGNNRGWDGWMASLTQLTWVWINSGSWWWTGKPGVFQSMGWQRVGHDWATECYWTGLWSPRNFQARILKWVAVPFSRGSSQPRDWTLNYLYPLGLKDDWNSRWVYR